MFYFSNNKIKQNYLSRIADKLDLFSGRNAGILAVVLKSFQVGGAGYSESVRKRNELCIQLWPAGSKHMASVFSGSEFEVLVALLGKEWAEKFKKIWDRSHDYIYPTGYDRRSFRTKLIETLYLSNSIFKLDAMIDLVANDFSYESYFKQKDNPFVNNPVLPDLLALEIDEGNELVQKWLQDIVYGDNNTGLITHAMIKGLLMSNSSEAHKWVGDLLLAAKLQEGLRQAIVECMDEGSREGFVYLLKLILDHNLARFSSVARALDVWTGLGISAQKPAVLNKCLETAYRCLTEDAFADECINGNDSLLIYMGLWSKAFGEVASTESILKHLLAQAEKYKRMVALFFLRQIKFPLFQHRLAAPLLEDSDKEVKCWVLGNLFPDANRTFLRPELRNGLAKYKTEKVIGSPKELFLKLKNMLDHLQSKELIFHESIFPWCRISTSSDDIIVKMLISITLDDEVTAEKCYFHPTTSDSSSVVGEHPTPW
ncbi:hypothetical protein DEAC_c29030 [Desulfosporosinus acididurans]|uniref:DUF5724 domain-containing protein n=1 Tax=Desulfosporosinus acididurans TaxID=476652 RepID=A0A0J1IKW6_9FIRM|nr:hypothetical protein [Desulfosporosinus acididurans]KLU65351.1 hypothetical protein DEAC_c29030 [Desulfosporosinus acididurans]